MSVTSPVLRWNEILLDTALNDCQFPAGRRDQEGPTRISRAAAMTHVAIHQVVSAIQSRANTLYPSPAVPAGVSTGSVESAIHGAALTVLVDLFPQQAGILRDRVPALNDPAGFAYGAEVGELVLEKRRWDGAQSADTSNRPLPAGDGQWAPDPVLAPPGLPLTPGWGEVVPFIPGLDVASLLPPAPEATLRGPNPSDQLDEVFVVGWEKETVPVGGNPKFTARTADQSQAAYFWAYDDELGTAIRLYNQVAQQVLSQEPAPPDADVIYRHARYFALLNVAMADAGIVCWLAKYTYNLWRPYAAIRAGQDRGLLPGENWLPLGRPHARSTQGAVPHASPNFPAYTSGHAAFGGALFGIMQQFFEPDFQFDLYSDMNPSSRPFPNSFAQAAMENSLSRLWLGVHWPGDAEKGQEIGETIAGRLWISKLFRG